MAGAVPCRGTGGERASVLPVHASPIPVARAPIMRNGDPRTSPRGLIRPFGIASSRGTCSSASAPTARPPEASAPGVLKKRLKQLKRAGRTAASSRKSATAAHQHRRADRGGLSRGSWYRGTPGSETVPGTNDRGKVWRALLARNRSGSGRGLLLIKAPGGSAHAGEERRRRSDRSAERICSVQAPHDIGAALARELATLPGVTAGVAFGHLTRRVLGNVRWRVRKLAGSVLRTGPRLHVGPRTAEDVRSRIPEGRSPAARGRAGRVRP